MVMMINVQKGKECEAPTQMIKLQNFLTVVTLLFLDIKTECADRATRSKLLATHGCTGESLRLPIGS